MLRKCLELAFPVIVVINQQIDRADARPDEVHEEIFDLFCDLDATDAQLDFPLLYAIGREGIAKRKLEDESKDLGPLFEMILEKIPLAPGDPDAPLQVLVSNVDHDDYVGRLGIGRIVSGSIGANQPIGIVKDGRNVKATVKVLSTFEGLRRTAAPTAAPGRARSSPSPAPTTSTSATPSSTSRWGGRRAPWAASTSSSRPSRCARASTPRPSPASARPAST